ELAGHLGWKKIELGLADKLLLSSLKKPFERPIVVDKPAFGIFHEGDGRVVVHERMEAMLFFFQVLLGLFSLSDIGDDAIQAENVFLPADQDAVMDPSNGSVR